MRKVSVVAGLLAGMVAAQPIWAAQKGSCYSQGVIEAEQAIRYLTDLMVASSACQNTTYAEFRLRNRDAIVAYQKAMIAHLHGTPAFDKWNTALANIAAQKQAQIGQTFCQQSEKLLKHAGTLDPNGFRAYASAQAASLGAQYQKCAGGKQ